MHVDGGLWVTVKQWCKSLSNSPQLVIHLPFVLAHLSAAKKTPSCAHKFDKWVTEHFNTIIVWERHVTKYVKCNVH